MAEFLDTLGTVEIGIVINDADRKIIYMNKAAESAADLLLSDVCTEAFADIFRLINVRTGQLIEDPFGEILKTGQAVMLPEHTVMIVKNKTEFHVSGFIAPMNFQGSDHKGMILTFINDTNRYMFMESIKESEVFYRTLFETMTEGCQIIGYDWKYLYMNSSAAKHARKTREELLGKTMLQVYPGIERTEMFSLLKECMNKRVTGDIDNLFTYPDGAQCWYHLRIRPVPEGIFILSLDIDDRKKMEQEIEKSRLHSMSLLEMIPEILIRCNSKGDYLDIITSQDEKLLSPKSELLGKNIADVFPKEKAELFIGHIRKTLHAKCLQKIEYSIPAVSGDLWYEARTTPLDDDETLSLIVDITELKNKEEKEFIEKERFRTILMSVGDGVVSVNETGKVIFINKAAEELTGCNQQEACEIFADELFSLFSERTMEKIDNPINKVLKTGDVHRLENHIILFSKNNAGRSVEVGAAPIKDTRGNVGGAVAVIRDVTERRRRLLEIEYISFHDKLTGLYNRRFHEEETKRLDTDRNLPFSIIYCDIDGLKMINDSFGHLTGDKYIVKAAESIKKGCRADDIISRIGGDEFAILLPKTTEHHAQGICRRILGNIKAIKDMPIQLSVTLAAAVKVKKDQNIIDTVKCAENRTLQNKLLNKKSSRGEAVLSLSKALYEMNYETEEHEKRLLKMAGEIGEALNLMPQEIEELKLLAILHDIGKLGISKEIIMKPGPLTPDEWTEMKKHSEIGYRIAEATPGLSHISKYILSVPERFDAYDVMISGRPYKKPIASEEAHAEIIRCRAAQFDPLLVDLFSKLYEAKVLS